MSLHDGNIKGVASDLHILRVSGRWRRSGWERQLPGMHVVTEPKGPPVIAGNEACHVTDTPPSWWTKQSGWLRILVLIKAFELKLYDVMLMSGYLGNYIGFICSINSGESIGFVQMKYYLLNVVFYGPYLTLGATFLVKGYPRATTLRKMNIVYKFMDLSA